MPFHDAYLRRTPFEAAFASADGALALESAVEAESRSRGIDPRDPESFLSLECVIGFVRSVRGRDMRSAAWVEFGTLVFHALHLARADRPHVLVTTPAAEALVGEGGTGVPPERPPSEAGYAQLPRHLFWVSTGHGGGAEPVDGWFWTTTAAGALSTLVVAGVREDRAGFAAIPIPEAPWEDAPVWMDACVRPDGEDFASTLPGGALGGLRSIAAAGEVLKLSARLFTRLASGAGRPGPVASGETGGPAPSTLPYTILER